MQQFIKKNELTIFKTILNALPNSIYVKDIQGRYIWLNKKSIKQLEYKHLIPESIIGKTDFDVFPEEDATEYSKNDKIVMKTKKGICKEEESILPSGKKMIQLSFKEPLYEEGSTTLLGVLGYTVDITELKKNQEEIIQLKIENESFKGQERFTKLANQVVHDIRSPLASLLMIVKSCTDIPEAERIALREAAISIGDIANHLLSHYQKNELNSSIELNQPTLVSVLLLQVLTDKKYQYRHLEVKFDSEFLSKSYFAFVRVEQSAFKRMLSNLINNAVDAFDGNPGNICLKLDANNEWVKITVLDDGKGMPPSLIEKITNRISVTAGKKEGHGIGFTQIWETIDQSQAELSIHSTIGKGTAMEINFPRVKTPSWITEEILLEKGDTVVILDDDSSIHGAWNTRFEPILNAENEIKIKHFQDGKEALNLIRSLTEREKENVFLLTDYELLKQELNGLHVIAQGQIKRSILVTSHFADPIIREQVAKLNTKILPKPLASEISIKIREISIQKEEDTAAKVDIIIVDDDEQFVSNLILSVFEDQKIDSYHSPEYFLKNISKYPKEVKILLDNNYVHSQLKGLDVAKELHNQGYQSIYILSGEVFEDEKIPDYVTMIGKNDIDLIKLIISI